MAKPITIEAEAEPAAGMPFIASRDDGEVTTFYYAEPNDDGTLPAIGARYSIDPLAP